MMLNELDYEFNVLDGKLTSISLDKILDQMGFPLNYKDIGRMK